MKLHFLGRLSMHQSVRLCGRARMILCVLVDFRCISWWSAQRLIFWSDLRYRADVREQMLWEKKQSCCCCLIVGPVRRAQPAGLLRSWPGREGSTVKAVSSVLSAVALYAVFLYLQVRLTFQCGRATYYILRHTIYYIPMFAPISLIGWISFQVR